MSHYFLLFDFSFFSNFIYEDSFLSSFYAGEKIIFRKLIEYYFLNFNYLNFDFKLILLIISQKSFWNQGQQECLFMPFKTFQILVFSFYFFYLLSIDLDFWEIQVTVLFLEKFDFLILWMKRCYIKEIADLHFIKIERYLWCGTRGL